MTTQDDLLRAVIDRPEDDLPRLVYADWLEEHGDAAGQARAELIRSQYYLARTKGEPSSEQRVAANARVRHLLGEHSRRWRKGLPRIPGVQWGPLERGMVESVSVDVWAGSGINFEQLDRVFGHAPLRTVRASFFGAGPALAACCALFLTWSGLPRFCTLRVATRRHYDREDTRAEFIRTLCAHDWPARPEVLDLQECAFSGQLIELFAGVPAGRRMPVIDIRKNPVWPQTVPRLIHRYGERVRL